MGSLCSSENILTENNRTVDRIILNETLLQLVQGNIVHDDSVAIVNPTNCYMHLASGITSLKIMRAAGIFIQRECYQQAESLVELCENIVTSAGSLPSKYIIHVASPVYIDGQVGEADLLRKSVKKALERAHSLKFSSLCLPPISTDTFDFPKDECARIMVTSVIEFLMDHGNCHLKRIRILDDDNINVRID